MEIHMEEVVKCKAMKEKIISALLKASQEKDIFLEYPENDEHGDFSTNIAMVAGKKNSLSPIEYAEEIVKKLRKDDSLAITVSKIEVVKPGFINFFLSEEVLISNLKTIIQEKDKYGQSSTGNNKTVVIDYASPNIAKRFGIGHLRSTIIASVLISSLSIKGASFAARYFPT